MGNNAPLPEERMSNDANVMGGFRFFPFTDLNGCVNNTLTLCQIIELLFMFVIKMPVGETGELTWRVAMTVTAWFEMCRTVCTSVLAVRGKMAGTDKKPFKSMRLGSLDDVNKLRSSIGRRYTGYVQWWRSLHVKYAESQCDSRCIFELHQGDDCHYFVVERWDKPPSFSWSRGSAQLALWSLRQMATYSSLAVEDFLWSTINKITLTQQVELTHRQLSGHGWTQKFPHWRRREECRCTSCKVIWTATAGKLNKYWNRTCSLHS